MNRIVYLWTAVIVGLAISPDVSLRAVAPALLGFRWVWPLGFVLGVLIGHSVPPGPVFEGPLVVQGRVAAAPLGRQADLQVWACATGPEPFRPCRGRIRVRFDQPVSMGSRWVVRGTASAPRRPGFEGGPDPTRSARLAGVRTVLWADAAEPLGHHVETEPRTGHAAVLAAIATGDRRGVDEETWALLRDTGTAHLLAISGFHVGVVAGLVGGLFSVASRSLGWLVPTGVPRAWAWWAGALGGVAYAWFAGAPISAQRAAGVGLLAACGRSLDRRIEPLRLVGLIALFVCMVDPSAISTPGFQLSFGAVLGLVRFGPTLDPLAARLPWGLQWAGRGLVATTAATLGTLPAAAWWFQAVAPGSPLANLLAIPWMSVGVVPWAVGAFALPEPLAAISEGVGVASLGVLFYLLDFLRFAPFTPAVDGLGALLLCAIFLRPRFDWTATVLLLVLGLRSRPVNALQARFFDVGQGDAALVDLPDGQRWLVDTGRSPALLPTLRRRGVRHLDKLILSHPDADHAGVAEALVCSLRVDLLVVGDPRGHESLFETAHACGVPWIVRASPYHSRNQRSLVVRAASPWGSVLFTGDIDAAVEDTLQGRTTVLKVPHHGSRTSSSAGFLDRIRPELAVLSVGRNYYGHPHQEVLDRYAEHGIPVVRTDAGPITVRLDAHGLSVHQAGVWKRRAITPKTTMPTAAISREIPWL